MTEQEPERPLNVRIAVAGGDLVIYEGRAWWREAVNAMVEVEPVLSDAWLRSIEMRAVDPPGSSDSPTARDIRRIVWELRRAYRALERLL